MSENVVLQVEGLCFAYPECGVLNQWSVALPAGLALVRGDESSGKTTLLRLLAGELTAQAGRITLQGVRLGDAPKDVLIVGAGLIGSELANDLALGGHRITLLDVMAQPLARWPSEQAGAPLLAAWQDLPIRFVGGVQVASVEKLGDRYRITTACGQQFVANQVIAAAGLMTPPRLAQSAALDWNNGIAVDAATLRTSDERIHALGDCITINGQASRYIEPIARQARAIAAHICGGEPVPYEAKPAVVRVKTTSHPMTLH